MTPPDFNWPADHRDILPDPTNSLERIRDHLKRGLITVDEANVRMVLGEGVRIVKNRLPREVRKALNDAVKRGELGHLKKDGHKPEVYFRLQNRDRALVVRWREEQRVLAYSRTVMVHQRDLEESA